MYTSRFVTKVQLVSESSLGEPPSGHLISADPSWYVASELCSFSFDKRYSLPVVDSSRLLPSGAQPPSASVLLGSFLDSAGLFCRH